MTQESPSIQRFIEDSLEERLKSLVDELSYGSSDALVSLGSFFLHGCLFAASIEKLGIAAKFAILCAIEEVLRSTGEDSFSCLELSIDRLVSSGDYGIDIKGVISVGNGYRILLAADGGSGNALVGEILDVPLVVTVGALCRGAQSIFDDWDEIEWSELCSQDFDIEDGSIEVSPDEGMEGFGRPDFSLLSPDGNTVNPSDYSLSVSMEGGTYSGEGIVNIKHFVNGENVEFSAKYDLSEYDGTCLGYNIGWEVSRVSFDRALGLAIANGLKLLRQQIE